MIRNQLATRNALVMQEKPLYDGGLVFPSDAGAETGSSGGDGPGGAGGSNSTRPAGGGGCGCSVPGVQPGLPAVAALLPLALLLFRRRRR
jgi:MYXO-CTERM domain-containing protein